MFELAQSDVAPKPSTLSLVSVNVVRYKAGTKVDLAELENFHMVLPMDWEDHLADIPGGDPNEGPFLAAVDMIGLGMWGSGMYSYKPEDKVAAGCSWDWETENSGINDIMESHVHELIVMIDKYVPPTCGSGSFFMLFDVAYSTSYEGESDATTHIMDPQLAPNTLKQLFGVM